MAEIVPEWLTQLLVAMPPDPPPAAAPPAYLGRLRPYQERALGFALHRTRTLLALDCGLGKTHIGLAFALRHLPAVVICPASLKSSWEEHLLSYCPSAAPDITVVSYNKMALGPETRCIVADEAHYLKHEGSQRSKRFRDLLRECPRALLLTGTPAQRNMDLFHLLKLLDPEHFRYFHPYQYTRVRDRFYFAERYTEPVPVWIGGKRHGFKFTKSRNTEELARVCQHFMLRMRKSDVVDLPTLDVRPVVVGTVSDPEYFQRKWDEIEEVRERTGNRRADVELLALCRETAQRKVDAVAERLRAWLAGHAPAKVLVFYHHVAIGDRLQELLCPDHACVRIDGKTSMKKRVALLRTFREDPACRVGILSMCATSTGLNLQFCTKIIFAELTFLSIHHTQAEARIHRIGQEHPVSVEYTVLEGTTDMLAWRSLCAKRATESRLFDGGAVEGAGGHRAGHGRTPDDTGTAGQLIPLPAPGDDESSH